jgi:hypothetical protein
VGQHNQRARERVGAAPGVGGVVHVAADDPAAKPGPSCASLTVVRLATDDPLAFASAWPPRRLRPVVACARGPAMADKGNGRGLRM